MLQADTECVRYLHGSCHASPLVCKQRTQINLAAAEHRGNITSHLTSLKTKKTHFAHVHFGSVDSAAPAAAALTRLRGITLLQTAALRQR